MKHLNRLLLLLPLLLPLSACESTTISGMVFTRTPYVDLSDLPERIQFQVEVPGNITMVSIGTRIVVDSEDYFYKDGVLSISTDCLKDENGDMRISAGEQTIRIQGDETVRVNCLFVTKAIKTAADLQAINQDTNSLQGAYILANDIDCSSIDNFEPIGFSDTDDGTHYNMQFNGVLDGNGYAIKNLTMHYNRDPSTNKDIYDGNPLFTDSGHSSGNTFGIFQEIGQAGIVRNITFSNINITGRTICGVVAGINAGRIENVVVDETCRVKMSTHFYDEACNVAGICGINALTGTVEHSVSATSDLTIVATYTDYDSEAYLESDGGDTHVFYNGARDYERGEDGLDSNGLVSNGIYAGVGITYGAIDNNLGTRFTIDPTNVTSSFSQTHIEANKSKDGPDSGSITNCAVYSLSDLKKAATYADYGFDETIFTIKDGALPQFKACYPYINL